MSTITVLIADDHALVRSGVRGFLQTQPDLEVLGEAANGAEAVRLAVALVPDVVLMDVLMPELDGVEATRRIRQASPHTQVIALTSVHDDAHVLPMIKAGALSYLLKDVSPDELAEAIRAAPNLFTALSEREQDVLRLIAEGLSNADIAGRLVLSEKTVKGHVSNILGKLHLEDRTQAAVLAWREGLARRAPG